MDRDREMYEYICIYSCSVRRIIYRVRDNESDDESVYNGNIKLNILLGEISRIKFSTRI